MTKSKITGVVDALTSAPREVWWGLDDHPIMALYSRWLAAKTAWMPLWLRIKIKKIFTAMHANSKVSDASAKRSIASMISRTKLPPQRRRPSAGCRSNCGCSKIGRTNSRYLMNVTPSWCPARRPTPSGSSLAEVRSLRRLKRRKLQMGENDVVPTVPNRAARGRDRVAHCIHAAIAVGEAQGPAMMMRLPR